jgi:7,8-dihydropterin-6-yl-methyl-4-(beta-D-ribofuranosyl)aminobenzene 5'-phosphate synthase
VLFDAGLTSAVVLHNAGLLGVDLHNVDAVVVSHGHPDHFGGIVGVVEAIGHPTPVVIHPDAFNPRMIVKKHITLPMINIGLSRETIRSAGGHLMEAREPIPLGPGLVTSGQMQTVVEFEHETPVGRLCVCRDGAVTVDEINDHQVLGIDIEGHGLVVIDPCGHRGIVSAVEHMRKLTGTQQVHAVMGGFHTGHPGISDARIEATAHVLADMDAQLIAPMHCSGFRMKAAISQLVPDAFEILTAGSAIEVGETK